MKSLLTLTFAIALACNSALAGSGAIVYCIVKASGNICSIAGEKSSGAPEDCCSHEQAENRAVASQPFECDYCADVTVGGSDAEAAPSIERIAAKISACIGIVSTDLIVVPRGINVFYHACVRPPPIQRRSSWQFTDTVLFRV